MKLAPSRILGVILIGWALSGCGDFSVPRVAAQGTTIMIPVPEGFRGGFGRALNKSLWLNPTTEITSLPVSITTNPTDPNYYLEDFQQGELVFVLRSGPSVTSTFKSYLPVHFITRVHLDEGSSVSLPAPGEAYQPVATPYEVGQVVALVDIPYSTPPDIYYIYMERWKRDPSDATMFRKQSPLQIISNSQLVDWVSWGGFAGLPQAPSPTVGMQIRIVASSYGSFFSDTQWGVDNFWGTYTPRNFTADLARFAPRPKLRIYINQPTSPAAWEWTIQYPAGKIEITGAELGSLHRSGGFVALSPATGATANCNDIGTTKISVIDPEQRTAWVNIAYRLRDFPRCGRALPGDFTGALGALPKAYDVAGNRIAAGVSIDSSYSF